MSYRATPDRGRVPYELNINYLDALGDPGVDENDQRVAQRFLTSQAVMLSLQGMPAIYFHSMFGSRGWPAGVADTGANRTVNRQKLQRDELENELRQPGSLRGLVFDGYRTLLRARATNASFAPAATQQIVSVHPSVFAVLRTSGTDSVLCLHNVSGEPVVVDAAELIDGPAVDLITGVNVEPVVEMGPYQTAWLTPEKP